MIWKQLEFDYVGMTNVATWQYFLCVVVVNCIKKLKFI